MYLGVKAVIAKSMARIHKNNLVNHGVVPMVFADKADYERVEQGDELQIEQFPTQIQAKRVLVQDKTKGFTFECDVELSDADIEVILAGGRLRYVKALVGSEPLDTI